MLRRLFLILLTLLIWAGALLADSATDRIKTLLLGDVRDFIWDATRSRFISSAGTNIAIVNPESAQVEDTFNIGEVADKIAVSDDGQYLYA
ncbi:MAG: hypothetical protein LLG20_09550, partial [Acidobacteriales bacterium]|nr:hypothetical protein [Terriglobales bacterium]